MIEEKIVELFKDEYLKTLKSVSLKAFEAAKSNISFDEFWGEIEKITNDYYA